MQDTAEAQVSGVRMRAQSAIQPRLRATLKPSACTGSTAQDRQLGPGGQSQGVSHQVRRARVSADVQLFSGVMGLQHRHSQENSDKVAEQGALWGDFYSKMSAESEQFPINQITDREIKLQLISLQDKGSGALTADKQAHLGKVMNEMSTIYSTATVCLPDDPFNCQTLEPGLEDVMFNSKDYYERLHVWEGWRQEVGKRMRPLYEDYVDLKNEAAKLNGFEDYGAYWRYNYETIEEVAPYTYTRQELMHDVRKIYNQIMPLYKELHTYVRARLMEVYPRHIDPQGPLPAHLLGDMWGRFWTNLYPLSTPYPDRPT
ncbi:hypothetical protein WMY93_013148 [Mugilogobius chulae]|uniref:Angiotensin-converting enzyme n=1 Tax=Mugilogobius chulae TaxID=88201 RepID=A0AAW0P967_9GOBI